jgi:alpha-tubulin suppressor-like RCC1 family protein
MVRSDHSALCIVASAQRVTERLAAERSLSGGGLGFRHISAGTGYSCGVTTAGVVYCWGDNSNGQLGDGTIVASERPVRVFLAPTAEAGRGSHPGP